MHFFQVWQVSLQLVSGVKCVFINGLCVSGVKSFAKAIVYFRYDDCCYSNGLCVSYVTNVVIAMVCVFHVFRELS